MTVPRAPGVTVTGTGASQVTFQSPASGGDLQGEVSTSVACPAQAPCEATLSVTATAATPGSGTTTLPWSVTPEVRGTGEDPPRGVRLATEEVP